MAMPFRETAKKRNADKTERRQFTRVPRSTRTRIIAALKADPDSVRVARKFDLERVTVWHIGRKAGIRFSRGISATKRAAILAALKTNPNARQVARQIGGASHATVCNIAKAEGIPLKHRR
jgi:hypothetical protein